MVGWAGKSVFIRGQMNLHRLLPAAEVNQKPGAKLFGNR